MILILMFLLFVFLLTVVTIFHEIAWRKHMTKTVFEPLEKEINSKLK